MQIVHADDRLPSNATTTSRCAGRRHWAAVRYTNTSTPSFGGDGTAQRVDRHRLSRQPSRDCAPPVAYSSRSPPTPRIDADANRCPAPLIVAALMPTHARFRSPAGAGLPGSAARLVKRCRCAPERHVQAYAWRETMPA
jgi:hypothetical protein